MVAVVKKKLFCRPQRACHPYGGMWAKAWDLCSLRPSIRFCLFMTLPIDSFHRTNLRWNDMGSC